MSNEQTAPVAADVAELYALAILAYRTGRERGESPDGMRRLRMRIHLAFLLWRHVTTPHGA